MSKKFWRRRLERNNSGGALEAEQYRSHIFFYFIREIYVDCNTIKIEQLSVGNISRFVLSMLVYYKLFKTFVGWHSVECQFVKRSERAQALPAS